MSIYCPRQQWKTTCDLCGYEAVQEIDELPYKWIAVVGGGDDSQVWTEEYVVYSDSPHPVQTIRNRPIVKGRVERVICPNCQTKLGMKPQED